MGPALMMVLAVVLSTVVGCARLDRLADLALPPADSLALAAALAREEPPGRDRWQQPDLVLGGLAPLRGRRVVDLHAGTGYFTRVFLDERPDSVLACTPDSLLATLLRASFAGEPRVRVLRVSAEVPVLPKAWADRVLLSHLLSRVADAEGYARALQRVLAPGGRLLVVEPTARASRVQALGLSADQRLSAAAAIELLQRAGFRSFELDTTLLPYHYLLRAE